MFTYDAQGEVENGQIFVQLKATDRLAILADQETISFPVSHADLEAWRGEPMPYILVVYDATADVAYWTYIQAHLAQAPGFSLEDAGATVNLRLSMKNILNEEAIRRFAQFRDAILAQEAILAQIEGVNHHDS